MSKAGITGKRMLVVLYLLGVHALAGLFLYREFVAPHIRTDDSFAVRVDVPFEETPAPTIIPVPSLAPAPANADPASNSAPSDGADPQPSNQNANAAPAPPPEAPAAPPPADAGGAGLLIPVAGVRREQLVDTFDASRSEGRVHDAIDIIAPAGTPVVAAADGEIAKFFDSTAGGITVYQYSRDKRYVYYYAHLQRRADGLREKQFVPQGTVIGYVGDTGNAGPGNNHLHFSIALLDDPKRYWEGRYLNPYPLLKSGREAR